MLYNENDVFAEKLYILYLLHRNMWLFCYVRKEVKTHGFERKGYEARKD